jgi:hypothetical protein
MGNNRLQFTDETKTVVRLDGKVVGEIRPTKYDVVKTSTCETYKMGYCYYPKGSTGVGEVFETKGECMHSLMDMD